MSFFVKSFYLLYITIGCIVGKHIKKQILFLINNLIKCIDITNRIRLWVGLRASDRKRGLLFREEALTSDRNSSVRRRRWHIHSEPFEPSARAELWVARRLPRQVGHSAQHVRVRLPHTARACRAERDQACHDAKTPGKDLA